MFVNTPLRIGIAGLGTVGGIYHPALVAGSENHTFCRSL